MGVLQRTPGRHVTRRLTEPDRGLLTNPEHPVSNHAYHLAEGHNAAVREYGSNSGGWHAYDPELPGTVGVFDGGPFPPGSVVSNLAWGRIDAQLAQRLLEHDGVA